MTVKPRTNYILDGIILSLFVVVMLSGLLLWQIYPDGGTHYRGGRGQTAAVQTVMGIAKPDMRTLHNWAGVLMGVLVLIHLVFHWKWVVCQTRRLLGLPARPQRSASKDCR